MNVCGVIFGGYLTKILSFKTSNLLNNSKFHLLSEDTVDRWIALSIYPQKFRLAFCIRKKLSTKVNGWLLVFII